MSTAVLAAPPRRCYTRAHCHAACPPHNINAELADTRLPFAFLSLSDLEERGRKGEGSFGSITSLLVYLTGRGAGGVYTHGLLAPCPQWYAKH